MYMYLSCVVYLFFTEGRELSLKKKKQEFHVLVVCLGTQRINALLQRTVRAPFLGGNS